MLALIRREMEMLNKEQYLAKLNAAVESLGFDKRRVIISHGGASMIHNLRKETEDIDVSIPKEYWDLLIENGCEVKVLPAREYVSEIKIIEYMGVDFHLEGNVDPRDLACFYGYSVTKQLRLLRDRIALGREKDVADIYKLQKYSRFLTSSEQSRMWSIQACHRGTVTF